MSTPALDITVQARVGPAALSHNCAHRHENLALDRLVQLVRNFGRLDISVVDKQGRRQLVWSHVISDPSIILTTPPV